MFLKNLKTLIPDSLRDDNHLLVNHKFFTTLFKSLQSLGNFSLSANYLKIELSVLKINSSVCPSHFCQQTITSKPFCYEDRVFKDIKLLCEFLRINLL